MKTFYTAISAIILFYHGNAQINAGQVLLGGSGSYEYQDVRSGTSKYTFALFTVSPSAGIFIIDKLATGLRVSFNKTHQQNMGVLPFKFKKRNAIFSPFARYYFLKVTKRHNVFIDGSLDFHEARHIFNDVGHTDYGNGFSLAGGPVIFITSHIAAEFLVGYSQTKFDEERRSSLISSIAFQFHFGNKKANENTSLSTRK